ncbi:hypothetical protein FQA39_LY02589 [Lamprigera yunnana]|nr:hypothetical protein FQA39_LY02589 [Lamprigera yunnana]
MYHPVKAANIIYACCVLYNIAKTANLLNEDEIEVEDNVPNENEPAEIFGNIYQMGTAARENYIRNNFA